MLCVLKKVQLENHIKLSFIASGYSFHMKAYFSIETYNGMFINNSLFL